MIISKKTPRFYERGWNSWESKTLEKLEKTGLLLLNFFLLNFLFAVASPTFTTVFFKVIRVCHITTPTTNVINPDGLINNSYRRRGSHGNHPFFIVLPTFLYTQFGNKAINVYLWISKKPPRLTRRPHDYFPPRRRLVAFRVPLTIRAPVLKPLSGPANLRGMIVFTVGVISLLIT